MTSGRVRSTAALAGLALAACHHRATATTTPIPKPPGEPPSVQPPIGSAPITDASPPPASPGAPDPRLRRYEIVAVDDTTFTILIGAERWVRRGTTGIAVDPRRRDALVARFRVISRLGDSAVALVTGQTTRVEPTHVALMRAPVLGTLRQKAFWAGLFVGLAAGFGTGLLVRH
ncbi:hypothetical protein tb265_37250 [Gemmatimonadetes bacterium T265]|nr:hypothetical protein tb265_37250 [Gemmatimonadetes bacterium T265]